MEFLEMFTYPTGRQEKKTENLKKINKRQNKRTDSSLIISIIKVMLSVNDLNTQLRTAQIENKNRKSKPQLCAVYNKLTFDGTCRLK